MTISKGSDILLESGTNELEIMEFTIAGSVFGINVAKVTEIMKYSKVNQMPNSHPHVEGVFKPREKIITVIDLPAYMELPESENPDRDMFIITNFNKIESAFHVHTVEGIHRISWADIEKPDTTIYGGTEGLATGIAKFKDKLITIIDFEKVVFDISPQTGIQIDEIGRLGVRDRSEKPILISEDSSLLRRMIIDSLHEAGYSNVITTNNGLEAWQKLAEWKEADTLMENVNLIITDIEMPKMDGHRLTKLVKEDPICQQIPLIIFSSLIDETMFLKGKDLGADAQITKPEIGSLVELIDNLIL